MSVQHSPRPGPIGLAIVICGATLMGVARAAEAAVEPEDLRPGLVACYRDTAAPKPAEVFRLEPTIALNLKAGESPHPRLGAEGGAYEWKGYLNVLRPGAYRFSARVRGQFRLEVGGKEVLAAAVTDAAPVLRAGPEVKLEAGVHPLAAAFTRLPGAARVELSWKGPSFDDEPMGYEQLGHLPKKVPERLALDRQVERGRFLTEEYSCVKCHQPEDSDKLARGLLPRAGPDLSQVGGRVYPGWIFRWLEDPHQTRAGAVMPRLFTADEAGRVERFAVAAYLASLGGPVKRAAKQPGFKQLRESESRGQRLFASLGCVACHGDDKAKTPAPRSFYDLASDGTRGTIPLHGLGSKTTPEALTAYLENPLAVDPSGRMPHMLLQRREAEDLANFLCKSTEPGADKELPDAPTTEQLLEAFRRVDDRADELAAFRRLDANKQRLDLGQRLVIAKGCNQCHTIAPGGKPFAQMQARASWDDLKKPARQSQGCLAGAAAKPGVAPRFHLSDADRQAIRRFLMEGTTGAGAPAPAYAARVTLQRFNCLACHSREGEGGLTPEILEDLRKYEKAENAEAVSPPPLTGVGHKLRTPWLRQVLTQAGRARPWMGLRMPQFGPANVGHLPEAFALMDGTDPDDQVHKVPLTAAKIEAGRTLVGKQAFGCISCHDIAGVANSGTRGPDLALMSQRVRYPWYRRWLERAQRMQPGTRMPTVFSGGKSTLTTVLDGNADAQAEAMWAYLSLGPGLPLPEGLEPPKGLVVQVKDRPVLLRTFMPDAGSRAIAIGYPGGVSVAFDAATCRLAYAWSGNFLDASPVWDNRGGNPAKVLGPRFWSAPQGCPWAVTDSNSPPDFAARAQDPAYGARPPDGKLPPNPLFLHFEGYTIDPDGLPVFRYQVNAGENQVMEVVEKPEPLHQAIAAGVARRFRVTVPAHEKAWFWAAQASGTPRLLAADGNDEPLDLKSGLVDVPAAGRRWLLPQGGDHTLVLSLADVPAGARWHLVRQASGWQLLLQLPAREAPAPVQFRVIQWVPYRDDPALVKELVRTGK